jgi:hypothetical protein
VLQPGMSTAAAVAAISAAGGTPPSKTLTLHRVGSAAAGVTLLQSVGGAGWPGTEQQQHCGIGVWCHACQLVQHTCCPRQHDTQSQRWGLLSVDCLPVSRLAVACNQGTVK